MRLIESAPEVLESELLGLIKQIATEHKVQPFIENPDFLEERLKKWHQFGLLSHTKKVRAVFLSELDSFLKELNVYTGVQNALDEKIDGIKKKKLLELSIPLHDLGKILVYGDEKANREHESYSKSLLSDRLVKQKLSSLKLTEKQIAYIGKCIKNHDVVGKQIRDLLKHEDNLNLSFLSTQKVIELCRYTSSKHPNIKIEIGVYFFCDSLGKTDLRLNARTDDEIARKEQEILETLKQKNLPQELKYAVMQLPVNIKLAEIYFKSLMSS